MHIFPEEPKCEEIKPIFAVVILAFFYFEFNVKTAQYRIYERYDFSGGF